MKGTDYVSRQEMRFCYFARYLHRYALLFPLLLQRALRPSLASGLIGLGLGLSFNPAAIAQTFELSSLKGNNGFAINGINGFDYSGISVSAAGDINGDGIDDVMIGAFLAAGNGNTAPAGESYIVFGSTGPFNASLELSALNGSNGFVINGVDDLGYAGASVSAAGDVNNDNIDDVIIGANAASGASANSGASYVVFGSTTNFPASVNLSDLNGSNGFRLSGTPGSQNFGISVSAAGDVNNDNIGDIIIGSDNDDPGGNIDAGASYVVFGSSSSFPAHVSLSSPNGSNGFIINGIDAGDDSGTSVSTAGDINDDGIDDLVIGADDAAPNGNTGAGESYVVFGSGSAFAGSLDLSDLNGTNGFVINGVDINDDSGTFVSNIGDINGDTIDDIIIGASRADPNSQNRAGESYVVFGSSSTFAAALDLSALNGTNGFVINGINADDESGYAVSTAGDVNGDGISDVIIGALPVNTSGKSYSGESYVVFGSRNSFSASLNLSALNGLNGVVINGANSREDAGFSVSTAGDINDDGFDDLIIGAPPATVNGNFGTGRSYIVFGGSEIAISGNNQPISDGDVTPDLTDFTDFGDAALLTTVSRTFTIANNGLSPLILNGGPMVEVSGAHAGDFSVTTVPASPVVSGGNTTFVIDFTPAAAGLRQASVSIANNDSDENPYTFSIQGTGRPILSITGVTDSVTEGGTLQYRAELNTAVSYPVIVDYAVAASGTNPVSSADFGINFPSGQTTIAAGQAQSPVFDLVSVDDALAEGAETATVTLSVNPATTGPVDISSGALSATGTLIDNDNALLLLSAITTALNEAGSSTSAGVTRLTGDLSSAITVNLSTDNANEATPIPASVVIPANQSSASFNIIAVDEMIDDGDQTVIITATTSAAGYDDGNLTITVVDDDRAGFTSSETAGNTTVTGTSASQDSFTVVLNSEPVSNVVLTLNSNDTSKVNVTPATLTFTPADWNVATGGNRKWCDNVVDNVVIGGQQTVGVAIAVDDINSDAAFAGVATQTLAVTVVSNTIFSDHFED